MKEEKGKIGLVCHIDKYTGYIDCESNSIEFSMASVDFDIKINDTVMFDIVMLKDGTYEATNISLIENEQDEQTTKDNMIKLYIQCNKCENFTIVEFADNNEDMDVLEVIRRLLVVIYGGIICEGCQNNSFTIKKIEHKKSNSIIDTSIMLCNPNDDMSDLIHIKHLDSFFQLDDSSLISLKKIINKTNYYKNIKGD